MYRRFFISGNWKMNTTPVEAEALITDVLKGLSSELHQTDVVVCPPFLSIAKVVEKISDSGLIRTGAQNLNENKNGAFTGEVSGSMIKEAGCDYVIIGHSERREYFGETDALVNSKIKRALSSGLMPILCVGEVLSERKSNLHKAVVEKQIRAAFNDIEKAAVNKIVVAYEPVWAIGTGETATPEQAQEMHAFIRGLLTELYGEEISDSTRILYGGSMKPDNAAELLTQKDVDGGLIGGASLSANNFLEIISIAENLKK